MAEMASYDYAGLGRLLRPRLEADGRGWRACAFEIGVSASDLSRISAGQAVSAAKVFAVCDWLGADARCFYRPPSFASRGAPVAPPPAAPAWRASGRDGQSPLPPPAEGGGAVFHGKSTETALRQDEEARP